ncbi:MAG: hypothetical protein AAFU57_12195 [Bacteroidota bacterium]
MQQKRKTYLLLALVVVVWGILGFRIVKTLSPDSDNSPVVVSTTDFSIPEIKNDSFAISANYRDPFLGTWAKADKPAKTKKKLKKVPPPPKIPVIYSGSMAENGKKGRMFFVTINGKQHLMRVNQTVEKVRLLKGNKETITVRYPGHTETISLQK